MTDKTSIGRPIKPRPDYDCSKRYTSCSYNEHNRCIFCGRKKGWKRRPKR